MTNLLPSFVILLIFLFALFSLRKRVYKKSVNKLDDLKEQDSEKWKKVIKYNAYLKLLMWSIIGLFTLGGGLYNFFKFPNGEKLIVIFAGLVAILFIYAGVSSYFSEMKKIR